MFLPIGDDVEREEAPFQFLTITILFACVGVFAWEITLPYETALEQIIPFTMIPAVVLGYEPLPPELLVIPPELTVFTSLFLHADWSHLIGNMVFLWVFGSSVEEACGHLRFILFYVLCGLAASLGHVINDPVSTIPTLGASGAISGLMGAYFLVYPFGKIKILMLMPPLGVVRVSALLLLGGWMAWQFYEIWMAAEAGIQNEGGVAWTAHAAGFITGMFLITVLRRPGVKLMGGAPEAA